LIATGNDRHVAICVKRDLPGPLRCRGTGRLARQSIQQARVTRPAAGKYEFRGTLDNRREREGPRGFEQTVQTVLQHRRCVPGCKEHHGLGFNSERTGLATRPTSSTCREPEGLAAQFVALVQAHINQQSQCQARRGQT